MQPPYHVQVLNAPPRSTREIQLFTVCSFIQSRRAQTGSKRSALQNFVRTDPESRKGMKDFTQEQKAEVSRVCNLIPQFEVEVDASVSGEPLIGPKDLVTATVTIFR